VEAQICQRMSRGVSIGRGCINARSIVGTWFGKGNIVHGNTRSRSISRSYFDVLYMLSQYQCVPYMQIRARNVVVHNIPRRSEGLD
jgi:hypothetical protein